MANAFPLFKQGTAACFPMLRQRAAVVPLAAARLGWIDTFRGVAIVAVAIIHTSSSCQKMRHSPDTAWFVFAEISRLLQFAVPAFLMLSTLVLTRSLLRDALPLRYVRNRARSVGWPLLLWSALCVPYVHWLNPGIAWHKAFALVWSGQADFHLYFLRVSLQLCLVLPLLLFVARRRPAFWKQCAATTVLTFGVLLANRFYFRITDSASWLFWYIPPVSLGLWLGAEHERWSEIAHKGWPAALAASVLSGAIYLPFALQSMEAHDVRALLYPLSWWVYSCGLGFLLFSLSFAACELIGNAGSGPQHTLAPTLAVFRELGRYSMQIYLLHPLVLMMLQKQMEQPGMHGHAAPGDLILLFASRLSLCLLWPMLLAWTAERLRLTGLLFGR